MDGPDPSATVELLRTDPVGAGLLGVVPVVVAVVQLLNSLLNGLPFAVSVPFAATLVAFSAVALRHHLARHRVVDLDPETRRTG